MFSCRPHLVFLTLVQLWTTIAQLQILNHRIPDLHSNVWKHRVVPTSMLSKRWWSIKAFEGSVNDQNVQNLLLGDKCALVRCEHHDTRTLRITAAIRKLQVAEQPIHGCFSRFRCSPPFSTAERCEQPVAVATPNFGYVARQRISIPHLYHTPSQGQGTVFAELV